MNRHWCDEELIGRMYGVGPEDSALLSHLEMCPQCASRRQELERRREAFVESARMSLVDENLLRDQRVSMWRRLENARRPWAWRLAPAGATALLLLFALVLHKPAPQPEPVEFAVAVQQQVSDEELFNEIASMLNETTPRAAKPMQGLFDTGAQMEVQ
jgi:hypothetical protein